MAGAHEEGVKRVEEEGEERRERKAKKGKKRRGRKEGAGGKDGKEMPLTTPWTFWYDRKLERGRWAELKKETPGITYRDLLSELGTFHTVEDFWRHYVYLRRPSELDPDMNLYCFRDGCTPLWEHYPRGGTWILKVRRGGGRSDPSGRLWQDLLFAAIGEHLGGRQVVGVHLATRARYDMLAVWTRDDTDPAARFAVSEKLKSALGLAEATVVQYKPHQRSLVDKSGFRNTESFVYVDRAAAAQAAEAARAAVAQAAAAAGYYSPAMGPSVPGSIPGSPALSPSFSPSRDKSKGPPEMPPI